MKIILLLSLFMMSSVAMAYTCQCTVEVHPPITGPHSVPLESKVFEEGREFGLLNKTNYQVCLNECRTASYNEFPYPQLQQVAYQQSVKLIRDDIVGYSCTGKTTFKYPVRFKANIGPVALGNIRQEMVIVHHEQQCF